MIQYNYSVQYLTSIVPGIPRLQPVHYDCVYDFLSINRLLHLKLWPAINDCIVCVVYGDLVICRDCCLGVLVNPIHWVRL